MDILTVDFLTFALLVVIAIISAVVLACVARVLGLHKRDMGERREAETATATIVAAKVLEGLRTQQAEALTEAREQRREAQEIAREQRRELNELVVRSNTQTAQLIQTSSEAVLQSLAGVQTAIRDKVDERLDLIQKSNEHKLEEMRRTVDEKLEATLGARLKNSFDTVTQQLESVNVRLGEMRSVADSVSSLNRTLSGSKTRGILGELQLSQIIEDMLPPNLYDKEAQVREGSTDRVDFAVKLPGQEEGGFAYLPIDSKFPLDDYYRLLEGYEQGDAATIDASRKMLLSRIKEFAKGIRGKYISPPATTNFAVMFLPTEGLYAEAVRDAAFFEELRKMDVMLAGPTTMSALLSSLLVGFKTLQIQKGAVEIQHVLENTKKEFGTFADVLVSAQKRIRMTGEDLDKLVGARTRKINAALRNVQLYTFQDGEDAIPELDILEEDEPEAGAGYETDSEAGTETDSEAGSETEAEASPAIESGSETEAEADLEIDSEVYEAEADHGPGPDSETGLETDSEVYEAEVD